jgi:DNA-binding response OmpR family regulator
VGELLVVEDDAAIGGVLTFSLQRQGHAVVLAASGTDALAAADIRAFDLALIDRGLPDMDGLDVCRGLRAKQSGRVLVMLTGRGEEIDVVLGLEAGADDYLTKPFRLAELMARVSAHLRRGRGGVVDDGRSVERRAEAGLADHLLQVGELDVDLSARKEGLAGRRSFCGPRSSNCSPGWSGHRAWR